MHANGIFSPLNNGKFRVNMVWALLSVITGFFRSAGMWPSYSADGVASDTTVLLPEGTMLLFKREEAVAWQRTLRSACPTSSEWAGAERILWWGRWGRHRVFPGKNLWQIDWSTMAPPMMVKWDWRRLHYLHDVWNYTSKKNDNQIMEQSRGYYAPFASQMIAGWELIGENRTISSS